MNELLATLAAHADEADTRTDWPAASWQAVIDSGLLAASVPTAFGGDGRDDLLPVYEQLASACLTTAFVLSQREAAVRRLRDADFGAKAAALRPLACGGKHVTVGISHLTTSAQHLAPAMRAVPVAGGYRLDGRMPWVTAADEAHHILAGATLDDGNQILVLIDTDAPGLRIDAPMPLMALAGSRTTEVQCDGVFVPADWHVAGPTERVLQSGSGGTGGLETSCLALGLTRAALDYLTSEAAQRPEIAAVVDPLVAERTTLWDELTRLSHGGTADESHTLRGKCNRLVLHATQAALLFAKGAGFVHPHPAQRWARQALFFLVWSCPRPAQQATLSALAPP